MGSISTAQKALQLRLHPSERRVILIIGDLIAACLALAIALFFWGQRDWLDFSFEFLQQRIPPWFFVLPVLWIILNVEMYDVRRASRRADTVKGVAIAAGISLFLYLGLFFLLSGPEAPLPRRGALIFIVATSATTLIWRFAYIQVFTAAEFMRRVLVVGAGRAGTTLVRVVKDTWPAPFHLIGFIDDDPHKCHTMIEGVPVLGNCHDIQQVIETHNITDIFFAISNDLHDDMFQALLEAEEQGVEVTTMPLAYENLLGRVPIFLLRSDWILRSFVDQVHSGSGLYEAGKRLLDIVGGLAGVVGLLILLPFIAIAIMIESGRPVLYTQARMGKNGKEYTIIKLRTMRPPFDKSGRILTDAERITRVGRILRKSHLDELPQVINVLRGEMSLVGPRAEISQLVTDLQFKVPFYRARLLVKPGLTGWAQVNYGYASTVEETAVKLEYDLYYIKHRNLLLDIVIMLRTVGTVIGLRGQ